MSKGSTEIKLSDGDRIRAVVFRLKNGEREALITNVEEGELERAVFPALYYKRWIRFVPKKENRRTPGLFENILSEIWRPHPGTMHLIIGYVEWILNLLPAEYEIIVERNDRNVAGDALFKEIRRVLEDRCRDIKLNDLIGQFGHNVNYYNRLIKAHTGMTFSAFLQNIKLEKAELFLKNTEYPVEEIARRVGYENLSCFYKIFREKFNLTPNNIRNKKFSTDLITNK
jgi:AraC-like DNA-binding protein